MKTVLRRNLPRRITEIEHTLIPMPDGTRLAARIWLPGDAEENPVPAILEYIPYRKGDGTIRRDSISLPYLAGHGYACVRVDLRGSGESDGVLRDEYLQEELDDGVEVIRWLRSQPWCTGRVGMMGISWGGFNGLQIAALEPEGLDAVITLCSTDDRYADDVHYMGGCLLGDNLSWASVMLAHNSCPPDPALVGERWREMWHERLRGSGLWLDTWLRHQRRDDYWKHGSVCEDFDAIRCPVMAISGWADGYSNAVLRLLAHLKVPRKGLIGPWSHVYPHFGTPGPAIGFLQEALRWWDRWLKDEKTGVEEDPMFRAWMQDSVPPTTVYGHRPGRWVAEERWPSPRIEWRRFSLNFPGRIVPEEEGVATPDEDVTIQSPLSVGLFAGKWCSYAAPPDLPHDQREEDGGALVFTSAPLESPLEILGRAYVDLALASDQPIAMIAVRLSDVFPDDKATRITYGVLNLTHRDSHEHPEPLEPGRLYRVRVYLNDVGQVFPAGHRFRISISTSYWPLTWPPPRPVRLTIHPEQSSVSLPARPPRPDDERLRPFKAPEGARTAPITLLEPEEQSWRVIRDLATDRSTLEVVDDGGAFRLDSSGMEQSHRAVERYSYRADDHDSLRGETEHTWTYRRDDWFVKTVTKTILTSDAESFFLHAELDAWEGEERVYSENWSRVIPRDHV
jgi:putative CocE/NonD family hydrolase